MAAGAVAAIGSVGGALIGDRRAKKQQAAANAARAQALAQFADIETPEVEDHELFYEMLQSAGDLTPQQEAYVGDVVSELENLDPRLRQAQMQALSQIAGVAEEGGLTPADMAMQRELAREVESAAQARDAAILQDMAQRGVAGSGMELAARLRGAQGATERMASEDDKLLAQALNRQMQASQQAANMAGNVRGADVGEAQAMDAIRRFNLMNQQNLQGRNVDRGNQAQQFNLTNRQRIADQNVAMRNQQQEANKALLQQQFSNQLALAQGRAGQHSQAAGAADVRAGQQASMWAGVGQGLGEIAMGTFGNKDKSKGED
jgi:hypothetical protein